MTAGKPLVTGVASGKGGVGKTLLAACIGTILNETGGSRDKVLLADLDFGVKGLTFLYGSATSWKDCSGSMADIVSRRDDSKKIIHGAKSFNGLVVVPAEVNFDRKINWNSYLPVYNDFVELIGTFIRAAGEQEFKHIIFDTGAGLDQSTVALSHHADRILVVVEPDEISLTAAIDLRAELKDHHSNVLFVVNKEPDDFPLTIQDLVGEEVRFLPSLPLDQKLHSRFVKDARRLALEGFGRTRYKRFVGSLTNTIFGISAQEPTMWDRVFRKTVVKIVFRFVGYGLIFLLVLLAILWGLAWWLA